MKRPKLIQDMFNFVRFKAFKKWPEKIIKMEFRRHAGYKLNLKNPQTFNEKLQWLKLYWFDPKATLCADKYSVRKFVEDRGLGYLLNNLYGVYDHVDDINIDRLPNEFVMKVTHGCGQNLFCTDKFKLNWNIEKKKIEKWLKTSHYYTSLEWVYRDIKPRIIVEKLIITKDGKLPVDYKVFCFNGKPKCFLIVTDRDEKTMKYNYYDLDWNHWSVKNQHVSCGKILPKPKELEAIIEYSKILSKGFPHVRIDFYIENSIVIFGECTFFHDSGSVAFEPKEYDYKLGDYLNLPKEREKTY